MYGEDEPRGMAFSAAGSYDDLQNSGSSYFAKAMKDKKKSLQIYGEDSSGDEGAVDSDDLDSEDELHGYNRKKKGGDVGYDMAFSDHRKGSNSKGKKGKGKKGMISKPTMFVKSSAPPLNSEDLKMKEKEDNDESQSEIQSKFEDILKSGLGKGKAESIGIGNNNILAEKDQHTNDYFRNFMMKGNKQTEVSNNDNEEPVMEINGDVDLVEAELHQGTQGLGFSSKPKASSLASSSSVFEASAEVPTDLGSWQKHTKGIGLKYLQKFGFSGRLGLREDGIARPVEAEVHTGTQGLGFSNKSKSKQVTAKRERVEEDNAIIGDRPGDKMKKGKKDDSWKRGKELKKAKKIDVDDLLKTHTNSADMQTGTKIIDMRSAEVVEVASMSDIRLTNTINKTEAPTEDELKNPKIGQELLYNLNLEHDKLRMEIDVSSREVAGLEIKSENFKRELNKIDIQLADDKPKLERIERIEAILDKIEAKVKDDPYAVTPSSLTKAMISLHTAFPDEFRLFGLLHLLPGLAEATTKALVDNWDPLTDPSKVMDIFGEWTQLADYFKGTSDSALAGQTRQLLEEMVDRYCLAKIRDQITNDWRHDAPEALIDLLSCLCQLIPLTSVELLLDQYVMPRLRSSVEEWIPRPDCTPIHTWLHPWLPLLRSKLSELYPEIRRKLGKALDSWSILDVNLRVTLKPWIGVFDSASFSGFLVRLAIPKLVLAIREIDLSASAKNANAQQMTHVLDWYNLLPASHFEALFLGEFFPRWLASLQKQLKLKSSISTEGEGEGEHIVQWYKDWRNAFPVSLLETENATGLCFRQPFGLALEMMSGSMEGEINVKILRGSPFSFDKHLTYFSLIEERAHEAKADERTKKLAKVRSKVASNLTFRELVEKFAVDNSLEFTPLGQREAGHQLYAISHHTVYLNQNVLFMKKKDFFIPTAIEELLN